MAPKTEAPKAEPLRLTAEDRAAIEAAIQRVFFPDKAEAEAAEIAESAHLRRSESAHLNPDAVRRTEWIEATAAVLADVRRRCWKFLPYHEAEELAAEVLTRELEAGEAEGRRGCVRARRLTPTYLKLTAKDWATGREASRLEELTYSDDDETLTEAAPDEPADSADDVTESEADHLYRLAVRVARTLWIEADRAAVFALAAALSDAPARELAEVWGIGLATWKAEASRGAAEIRASYPDPADLITRLLPEDRCLTRRQTPLEARRIGNPAPSVGRHRTAAQLDREADWLLAAEQRPGRHSTASKRTDGRPRIVAPPSEWARTYVDRGYYPAGHRRRMPAAGPNHGPRPHRAASHAGPIGRDNRPATAEPQPHGWSRVEHGSRSLIDPAEGGRPTYSHTSQPKPCWPTVRYTPRTVPARSYPTAPREDFTRYPLTRREVWRMVFTPPRHRPTVLLIRSLDTAVAGENQKEHERPFSMVADMIETAA